MPATTVYPRISYAEAEASLPASSSRPPSAETIQKLQARGTLVVLDDDPTGTQTVHDITVLTTFETEVLITQLKTKEPGFFILTNSRAYHHNEASTILQTLLQNLHSAAAQTFTPVEIVLRSDSTLRGHFPLENDLTSSIFGPFDTWLLAPSFFQGGRVTIDDVHYALDAADDSTLVPVGDTPSAQDRSFGFRSSNLRDWVAEKCGCKHIPEVVSISTEELRGGDDAASKLAQRLRTLASSKSEKDRPPVIIPNTFTPADMETLVAAIALAPSVRLLCRTGASFVSTRLGISTIPPLTPSQLFPKSSHPPIGGLIVIGSYVPRTTAQRTYLLSHCSSHTRHFEIDIAELLNRATESTNESSDLVQSISQQVDTALSSGKDAVVSTSRTLISPEDGKESLALGSIVTGVLVDIVRGISVRPRYVIAKGGITSSDIATEALAMKKARVVGQAATGVPLWRSDQSVGQPKWPDVPYVVFPGNVGTGKTLGELVAAYRGAELNEEWNI
ncbi:MAG: hypothetical protein Q9218_005125 [Villophora microphyllina]